MAKGTLSGWDRKEVNKWWIRGIDKERARLTNAPKPFKGDKFSVPTQFSTFAPQMPPSKKLKAK